MSRCILLLYLLLPYVMNAIELVEPTRLSRCISPHGFEQKARIVT